MKAADLSHKVRKIEACWIPMRDGARLAATVWLPERAEEAPVPALLEYIPYRRRDFTASRDALSHPYFAGRGYASVRVDMRGSGDSDGILRDEYLPQEQEDGVEVLNWIAAQPWCDGNLGMFGISWGGFNSLQIAARRPHGLKAVISVASSDDRYADDVHHMGGCLLGDNLSWASVMFAYNSLPPDPLVVGERWRDMWLRRLHHNEPWLDIWLRHQRRDNYWRQASICENYEAIECPVMLVSGWADGYSNAIFRMLENLTGPRKALIGPWSHRYPHIGIPGPAIDFLQESVSWWDRWLKAIENGIDYEPMLRVWMQHSVPPTSQYEHRPGHWVAETQWPSPRVAAVGYSLGVGRLGQPGEGLEPAVVRIRSPLSVGLFAGKWCSYGGAPDLAHDQRQEDGGALVFEGAPLEEPLEILGAPILRLRVASDRPIAMIAARLSEVAPDGAATRVTYGLFNLTHRESDRFPKPLEPGQFYDVFVRLNEIGQRFAAGNRLRVSVSTSYWPLAWAPPEPVQLTIQTGSSELVLPHRPPRAEDASLRPFDEPATAPPLARTVLDPEQYSWRVVRDLASDVSTLEVINDRGRFRIEEHGLVVRNDTREWYSFRGDDFLSLRGEARSVRELSRSDWHTTTVTSTVLTSTSDAFQLRANLDAYEGDKRVYCRSWDNRIPRDFL